MLSWRVVLLCALVAFLATASAKDVAQCEKDGWADGLKVAVSLCNSKMIYCEMEKATSDYSNFNFPDPCKNAFFLACRNRAAFKVEPCGSFKGPVFKADCTLDVWNAFYDEEKAKTCYFEANNYA